MVIDGMEEEDGSYDGGAVSDDDELEEGAVGDLETEIVQPDLTDNFIFGTEFEKVVDYDHYLDEKNPWHEDLVKPLFDAQIIGFHWMIDQHEKGGGLVGDKVGCGKVLPPSSHCLCR
jgi:hypothetical protein